MEHRGELHVETHDGSVPHIPVMLAEVLEALRPKIGETVVDGTFGAGSYSRAILSRGANLVAIDRDPDAFAEADRTARAFPDRMTAVNGRFGELADLVADRVPGGLVDGVVLDIGVSSMQLDQAERGFSFAKDGPLDMRMGGHGPTAADVVNRMKPGDLARVFSFLGEERHAGRAARAIEARRGERPFERTLDFAGVVGKAVGRAPGDRIDPATRVFQALRIFVNDELGELARALVGAERVLKPGGRLVVVSFHSLEDRIVKRFLRDRSEAPSASRHMPDVPAKALTFEARNRALAAGEAECAGNPRARSAKLRFGTRTAEPPRDAADPLDFAALPSLAALPFSGA
ncbi:16S rRNA (cytosine(1402)-N(4))-methyltransferase RsmH [Aureimonas leprariae]|uniref:Ribosomal RNA small subunit methyltransferase H n=2 Tax=Plantimonas leprariae TaxID=2615207 RepID=A0A7V7PRA7_9HYPH|nr:16S rRNA (cytosine(1402)-N(4))-methyltransferase RsmH [Aureimonas leprariae]KAB0680955.1 16S rRNA (cytosine(1402)-N(4))-methyltransferase RsmH [Aureimonas leprariae]